MRIYLIYRFAEVFLGKTEAGKRRTFYVCATYFVVNVALFWVFHMAWINFVCNFIGTSTVVCLYTRSAKTNVFVTCSITLISIGCDVVGTLTFISYEDGKAFSQIYEVLTVFLFIICWFLAEMIVTTHNNVEQTFKISLVVVPLCSIAIVLFLIYSNVCKENGIAIVGIGLLVINFFMLYLYNQLLYSVSQKFETEMLEHKVKIYSNQLDVILQSEEKTKALMHDMRHHICELKILSNKYGAGEIRRYVEQMEKFMCNPGEIVSSGNVEIDSVLNYMLREAKEELTTVIVKVMLPEKVKHSFDINVLLGNLLENAIDAAKGTDKKYLNVDIELMKGILKLQIDNSFLNVDIVRKEDGNRIYRTTKKRKEQHGIGLKNVKKIVEFYHGDIEIEINEDIFSVKTFLYISETDKLLNLNK